mmetsp:Transcript_59776/g.151397  ORF Transcript_59776/g.151397 Transcript_59776/m.151397 type:complete len:564 (-) Transcript_59776:138-1829(-)
MGAANCGAASRSPSSSSSSNSGVTSRSSSRSSNSSRGDPQRSQSPIISPRRCWAKSQTPAPQSWCGQTSLHVPRPFDMVGSSFADDDMVAQSVAPAAHATAQPEPDVSGHGPLSISTRIEYTALPRGRAQDVFGIVTVQADAIMAQTDTEKRQPLDVICVLDVSGSMTGQKLSLVQDAVRFVIGESQPQDRLSIVTFNSSAQRPLRLCCMDGRGKDEATAATLRLTAGGGTCIANGLETALEVAEKRRQRNPVSAILLLTDGQDGSSRQQLPSLVARAQRTGCSLYTFGFGADHDARLLADLAEQAQTPFTFVEDVDQIGAAFAGAVGGLASVAAQRVEVVLDTHATLKAVHTPFSVSREGPRVVVQIPDMLAGERRDVLVELSVAAETGPSDDTLLLQASAKYWNLTASAAAQTPSVEMRLVRQADDEPQPELEPDEEVATQRNRVEVAQALQVATAHGDEGRFDEAQAVLAAHEQRLRSAKRKTAVSESLLVELEDARHRMSSFASWHGGGSAEVRDSMQMHLTHRTTNMSTSSKCTTKKKSSKSMYLTSYQTSWVSKWGA